LVGAGAASADDNGTLSGPDDTGVSWSYTTGDTGVTITGCLSGTLGVCTPGGLVAIPGEILTNEGNKAVTVIGESAFETVGIASIALPDSITRIDDYAFRDNKLTALTLPASLQTIGNEAFWQNCFGGGLYSSCSTTPPPFTLIVPNTVTTIGPYAFGMNVIADVTFGAMSSLQTIGERAFLYDQFTNATLKIPDSVMTIGQDAFSSSTGLVGVEFSTSSQLVRIDDYAFSYSDLASVTFPSHLRSIGDGAFDGSRLTEVFIPANVEYIGQSEPFQSDTSSDLSDGTALMTKITVDSANPNYSSDAFGVLYNKDKSLLIQYPSGNTAVTSFVIPPGVTTISEGAFENAISLTGLSIPNSVKVLQQNAFILMSNLSQVVIGTGLTTIPPDTFSDSPLAAVYFAGNAPTVSAGLFSPEQTADARVYRFTGATGFGNTGDLWHGLTVTDTPYPAMPAAPVATAGLESASISIAAPTIGPAPTSYTITATPGGKTCTVVGASGTCSIAGLTAGTSYTFTAVAHNGDPTPSWTSDPSNAVTPTGTSIVLTLSKTTTNSNSITVSFTAPEPGAASLTGATGGHRTSNGSFKVCSAKKTVKKAGKVTMTCTLSNKGKSQRKQHALHVTLTVTFTPTGATAASASKNVTFLRAKVATHKPTTAPSTVTG